ncbi:MAG: pyridoxal phosphate-dependent aminotransferase [Candidatus Bathyarchaeota archaeon]|nr:pyridoxal phosphate-dependent aminotransferase [Candidatus Bathyarchaeota archaeon]MDH5786726.1 pyridoxal phosphate-dependent aminotransferase [Candidatus Bathyarchaeota archaeon]
MKHNSAYLDWYINVSKLKYDLRSSGIAYFKYDLRIGDVDLSINYAHGNPDAAKLLARRYHVQPENVFISSEGASGQNVRVIRCLAERNKEKKEAIVEYPTYEPLLRQVQEHFPSVKRLERKAKEAYRLNADALRRIVSEKTELLVLTNPHAPSGALSDKSELREIMTIAREYGFYVLCDEIYAEFSRDAVPTIFSVDQKYGIVTTSFTKAYGLGGLKLGTALAEKDIVDELYKDVINTVGNSPNVVQLIAVQLLSNGREKLESHKQKWVAIRNEAENWLNKKDIKHFPNKVGVTYWIKLPIKDTYKWINEHTIPRYRLAPVPGTFFLFKNNYKLERTDMIRLGLGGINPDKSNLREALETLEKAMRTC